MVLRGSARPPRYAPAPCSYREEGRRRRPFAALSRRVGRACLRPCSFRAAPPRSGRFLSSLEIRPFTRPNVIRIFRFRATFIVRATWGREDWVRGFLDRVSVAASQKRWEKFQKVPLETRENLRKPAVTSHFFTSHFSKCTF